MLACNYAQLYECYDHLTFSHHTKTYMITYNHTHTRKKTGPCFPEKFGTLTVIYRLTYGKGHQMCILNGMWWLSFRYLPPSIGEECSFYAEFFGEVCWSGPWAGPGPCTKPLPLWVFLFPHTHTYTHTQTLSLSPSLSFSTPLSPPFHKDSHMYIASACNTWKAWVHN